MEKAHRRSLSMSDRVDVNTALSATRQSLQYDMGATQFSMSSRPMSMGDPASPTKSTYKEPKSASKVDPTPTREAKSETILSSPEGRGRNLEKSPYLAGIFKDDNIAKLIRKRLSMSFNKRAKSKV